MKRLEYTLLRHKKAAVLVLLLLFFAAPLPRQGILSDLGFGAAAAYAQQQECLGSVMSPISAAFLTNGLWMQGDVVYQLGATDLGLWAPLIYIVAVFFGLLMMALGQPPKLYLWWLIGPALYQWLLFTPTDYTVGGACWNVAGRKQDMGQVWRLAELGLINNNAVIRDGVGVSAENGPNRGLRPPMVFAWFDELISAQIEYLVAWSGVYSEIQNPGGETNTHAEPAADNSVAGGHDRSWYILSNSKWPMLENITAATLSNQDLRQAFVRFMAGECGDILGKYIDRAAFASANIARGEKLPDSVLVAAAFQNSIASQSMPTNMGAEMASKFVPMPAELITLLYSDTGTANDLYSFRHFDDTYFGNFNVNDTAVNCQAYLYTLIQGFRWEAGLAYNQIVGSAGGDSRIPADTVVYNFLYGWRFGRTGGPMDVPQQRQYIQDLILLYLFRNELALAPNPVDQTYSSSHRSENYVKAYARNVGSKSKYSELYMWAQLMPYLQGVLLYILAVAYPFVCLLIVVPGWHKSMVSWMGFYAWAKSWDAGFAIVMSIERSIWGMLGNSSQASRFNGVIEQMNAYGSLDFSDGALDNTYTGANCNVESLLGCLVPKVSTHAHQTWLEALRTFDKGMVLAANLDLDLQNGYYIYLMSALYFAVPAVTGQVLLGAKAGASSMVTSAVGGSAQEGGRAAGSGYTGELATRGHHAMATTGQEAFAKGLRKSGLGMQWLDRANAGLTHDIDSSGHVGGQQQAEFGAMAVGQQANMMQQANNYGRRIKDHASLMGRALGIGGKQATPGAAGAPAAGAGAGGGGGAPASVGNSQLRRALNWGKGAARTAGNAINGDTGNAVLNNMVALANDEVGMASSNDQLGFIAKRGQHALGQFYSGGMGKVAQVGAQRYQAMAQQQAAESQWRAMRNLANQLTGLTAACGVFAGAYVAGQKPVSIEGMMGMGMLNTYGLDGQVAQNGSGNYAYAWQGGGAEQRVGRVRQDLQQEQNKIDGIREAAKHYPGDTVGRVAAANKRAVTFNPAPSISEIAKHR